MTIVVINFFLSGKYAIKWLNKKNFTLETLGKLTRVFQLIAV